MKYKLPYLAAIFFCNFFTNRGGGGMPPAISLVTAVKGCPKEAVIKYVLKELS